MNAPVVIACFLSSAEAARARAALEREAIDAVVQPRDDSLPRLCADAFDGGLDVVTEEADAQRAVAVLQALWPDEIRLRSVERCPACGSAAVARMRRLAVFAVAAALATAGGALTGERDLFLLMLALVGVLLLITPNRRCRACGERWRGSPAPLEEDAHIEDAICPLCGSPDTETIDRRRERAATLLVNWFLPPTILLWPFLARRRCSTCGHEWR